MKSYKFSELIEEITEYNTELKYGLNDIVGVTIEKALIPTIANLTQTSLEKFYIVKPNTFVYNPRTHGVRLGMGYNQTERTYITTWNNFAFKVKDTMLDVLNPDYLWMYFNRSEWDRETNFKAWGSSTIVFSWNIFMDMSIKLPEKSIQDTLVKQYTIIKNRIELKKKINDNLEATASAMFKERFSMEKANPEWLVGTLQDLYTFQYGKGNNNPDNGGVYPVYGSNGIIGGYDEYNNEDAPVIGHIGINCGSLVFAFGKHFVTYNGVMCNVNNPQYKYFGYLTLANSRLQAHVRGSSQPFVSYDMLYEIKAVLPPSEIIERFEKQVTPLFEQVSANQMEIKNLLELQTIQLARLAN